MGFGFHTFSCLWFSQLHFYKITNNLSICYLFLIPLTSQFFLPALSVFTWLALYLRVLKYLKNGNQLSQLKFYQPWKQFCTAIIYQMFGNHHYRSVRYIGMVTIWDYSFQFPICTCCYYIFIWATNGIKII